jgi:hypothetical protein
VQQLLTESLVLSALGTGGALVIARALPRLILSALDRTPPPAPVDTTVLGFALASGALVTVICGLAPALRAAHINWRHASSHVAPPLGAMRSVLLAAQVALSVALVAGAALLARSALVAASGAHAGFRFEGLNAYLFAINTSDEESADRQRALTAAVMASDLALADASPWEGRMAQPVITATTGSDARIRVQMNGLNHHAIDLLGLRLRQGRWAADDPRAPEAVVSGALAQQAWGTVDPLGKTFVADDPFRGKVTFTVVGVMDEIRMVDASAQPSVITTVRTMYAPVILGPDEIDARIRTTLGALAPKMRVGKRPLVDGLRKTLSNAYAGASIATGVAGIALVLAAFGVVGVFGCVVQERRREIGVRLALGATMRQLSRAIVLTTRLPLLAGAGAGAAGAWFAGTTLQRFLYGLSPFDPVSLALATVVLVGAALIATVIPLRRASRISPAEILGDAP